jgi:hypothetical protein
LALEKRRSYVISIIILAVIDWRNAVVHVKVVLVCKTFLNNASYNTLCLSIGVTAIKVRHAVHLWLEKHELVEGLASGFILDTANLACNVIIEEWVIPVIIARVKKTITNHPWKKLIAQ